MPDYDVWAFEFGPHWGVFFVTPEALYWFLTHGGHVEEEPYWVTHEDFHHMYHEMLGALNIIISPAEGHD